MSKTFKHRMLVWFWDSINAFLMGIISGLLSIVGADVVGAVDFTMRQLAVVSVVGGVVSWANYVRQHRLPEIDPCDDNTVLNLDGKR